MVFYSDNKNRKATITWRAACLLPHLPSRDSQWPPSLCALCWLQPRDRLRLELARDTPSNNKNTNGSNRYNNNNNNNNNNNTSPNDQKVRTSSTETGWTIRASGEL
jgi:hypothetical protein